MGTHRKGIVWFLLIAFGLAWPCFEAFYLLKATAPRSLLLLLIVPAAFAPAIACFVVRKWITREGFGDAGLALNLRKWPYYLFGWFLPLPIMAWVVFAAPRFGAGAADLSFQRAFNYVASLGGHLPPSLPRSLPMFVCFCVMEALFATPILFGEEFGWRGYLQMRLFPANPVLSAVVTGIIWGLWHLPLTLHGYGFPDSPKVGALVMYPFCCIVFSIIFRWLVLKTRSIWASSLAHASTNAVGAGLTFLLFAGGANLLVASYVGVLGLIPLTALCAWIVFTGQLQPATNAPTREALSSAAQAG